MRNIRCKYIKKGGNPDPITVDMSSIGDLDKINTDAMLGSSTIPILSIIASKLYRTVDYVHQDTITQVFTSTITSHWSEGLFKSAATIGLIGSIAIGSIIGVSLIVVAHFYMILRKNNYAFRNAMVKIYEFYETLDRLNNLLLYIDEVSKTLEPPLQLDTGDIYQDIINIFEIFDLIILSNEFKIANKDVASGEAFDLNEPSTVPTSIPDNLNWKEKLNIYYENKKERMGSIIKSIAFNETKWINKMNTAVTRFNTNIMLYVTEWKIISDLRSKNTEEEKADRLKLNPLKCILRHTILAPIIRIRHIMYTCSTSTQSELCLRYTSPAEGSEGFFKKFWNKWIKSGGKVNFKNLLLLLKREISIIIKNSEYSTQIDSHIKSYIESLYQDIENIESFDITQIQYENIYLKVETIFTYISNCTVNKLIQEFKTMPVNVNLNKASIGTAQRLILVGKSEMDKAKSIIAQYTFLYETLLIKFGDKTVLIDDNDINTNLTGAILLKIPYNRFLILPVMTNKYEEFSNIFLAEMEKINKRIEMNLSEIYLKDKTVNAEISLKMFEKSIISNDNYKNCKRFTESLKFLYTSIESIKSEMLRIHNEVHLDLKLQENLQLKSKFEQELFDFKTWISEIIDKDTNMMKNIVKKLPQIQIDISISNDDKKFYFELINIQYLPIIDAIITQGENNLYNSEFISIISKIQKFFNFLKNVYDDLNTNVPELKLSARKSFINGNSAARYLLFAYLINSKMIYFKSDQIPNEINNKLHDRLLMYSSFYNIDIDSPNQLLKIGYINFLKGFLCSIDEVRLFTKIDKLENPNVEQIGCDLLSETQYRVFNENSQRSHYGGYKSKTNKRKTNKSKSKSKNIL